MIDNGVNGDNQGYVDVSQNFNQQTFTQNENPEQLKSNEVLNSKLFTSLKENRSILKNLKADLNEFKILISKNEEIEESLLNDLPLQTGDVSFNDNEIKNEDIQVPNSSKINSIIEKYQTRVDELEAQLLDQDDLIQEHEKSTQTLMSSFRSRCAALLEESHLLRKKYEANLAEEKLLNSQLAQENFKLRSLLQKLTDSVKSGILDHLEEDEMIYQEELSRLESENSSLRNLLKISENL